MMTKDYVEKLTALRKRELELACLQYYTDLKDLKDLEKVVADDFMENGFAPTDIDASKLLYLQERITRFQESFDIVALKFGFSELGEDGRNRTRELFLRHLTMDRTTYESLSVHYCIPISRATFYRARDLFFQLYSLPNRYKFTAM